MARPPLPLGTAGAISVKEVRPRNFRARCRYRQLTGRTVHLERGGPSKTAALRNLQDAIREQRGPNTGPIRPHDKFSRAAELWRAKIEARVAAGTMAATTADLYLGQLRSVVLPALGELRVREVTIGHLDMFFTELAGRVGRQGRPLSAPYRRSIRDVTKQVLDQAVKHEALPANPVDHIDAIHGNGGMARGLTPEERRRLLAWMAGSSDDEDERKAQEAARRRDLPDLVRFMIGTGVRIGEALGLRWCDVDLEGIPIPDAFGELRLQPVVAITGNIVRVKGAGLVRHLGKTPKSLRVVPLPRFVVELLSARRPDGFDPEWPVFATVGLQGRGVTWRDPRNVSGELLEMRRAMGWSWSLTSHTFRKTAATIWHDAGTLSDRQSADLVGHSQITTLLNYYITRGELHPEGAAVMDAAWMDT